MRSRKTRRSGSSSQRNMRRLWPNPRPEPSPEPRVPSLTDFRFARVAQHFPAGIGFEAWALLCFQFKQLLTDIGDATLARIVKWPAPKRRKASPEDHRTIGGFRIGNNTFPQTAHQRVEHRQDHAVSKIGLPILHINILGRLGVFLLALALLIIGVEALARLAAGLARLHLPDKPLWNLRLLFPEPFGQHPRHFQADVEPHLVG